MAIKCPKCHSDNPDTVKFCGECGTQLPTPQAHPPVITETLQVPVSELTTGSTFAGRYQIIEELGHGGMGKVYKVYDTKIKEKVALKLIKPEIAADKETIDRFSNEIRLARRIGHRNVSKMFDIGEAEGTHFITMEYVPGEDLKSMIRMSGSLSLGMLLSVGKQLCDGLAEAHSLGIVHRDLKPQNIMIDKNGNAKIMDFGIARSIREKGITGPSMMIGTPEYMSPEQVEAKSVDQRSDIYSVGVILYEMATSDVPFTGETALSIAMKHKGEAPKDPRKLNPVIPADLSAVILKCLEKDKAKRFQSAVDVRADLERIEKGLATTEKFVPARRTISSKEISIRFNLKNKALIPVLGFLGVLAIAFIAWQLIPRAEGARRSIAVITFNNQTGDKAYDYLQEAIPNLLITSLEQSKRFRVTTWERLKDFLGELGKERDTVIDQDLGFVLCQRKGIETIVVGSFTKAGGMFATDAKVWDVGARQLLRTAGARGDGVDNILRGQIDELSRQICRGRGLEALRIEKSPAKVAEAVTDSLEAYNFYLRGREDLERWNFVDARKFLEKAVELDPTFAAAYLELGDACYRLGLEDSGDAAVRKAMEHSAKAPEKERLFIESGYAYVIEKDGDKRIRILQEIERKYPDEKRVHLGLGMLYSGRYMYPEAIGEFQKALAIAPQYRTALNHLAYAYADSGDLGNAIEYFQKYATVSPGDPNPLDSIAEVSLRKGNLDEAIRKYREVLEVKPDFILCLLSVAYIYGLMENYPEAMKTVEEAPARASTDGAKLECLLAKAFLHYWAGNTTRALVELKAYVDLATSLGARELLAKIAFFRGCIHADRGEFELSEKAYQDWADYWEKAGAATKQERALYRFGHLLCQGLLDVKRGKIKSARAKLVRGQPLQSQEIAGFLNDWVTQTLRCLEGDLLLAETKPEDAVKILERNANFNYRGINDVYGLVVYHLPLEKDALARAYRALGETDKAIAEYGRLMTIDPTNQVRQMIPPIYHYRLAGLYETKGDKVRAREQYQKFLEIWRDTDPSRPELVEAKRRLADLGT